ncbi:hypothetical protein CI610_00570 [invertebrate metagenome]|uniref:Uncharacterized protein n=1 Tax=invertebrate metagenome TaxID=1711999 RepID=A0A2H9TB04_9ZZZZ
MADTNREDLSMESKADNEHIRQWFSTEKELQKLCKEIVSTQLPAESHDHVTEGFYVQLNREFEVIKRLTRQWQSSGNTFWQQQIEPQIRFCTDEFEASRQVILDSMEQYPDSKNEVISGLKTLNNDVDKLNQQTADYQQQLKKWEEQWLHAHSVMNKTVGKMEAKATAFQAEISALKQSIHDLNAQIASDKKQIDQAKKKEKKSVVQTIFGAILGAAGGAGAILAAMGVSSIAEAEGKVAGLEKTISHYKREMAENQVRIARERQSLLAVKALAEPAGTILTLLTQTGIALDHVRTSWSAFSLEMAGVIRKLQQAESAEPWILEKAWFNAACDEWSIIGQLLHNKR